MKISIAIMSVVFALAAVPAESQTWTKCIGDQIVECLSCVLEDAADLVQGVIDACVENPVGTVDQVLKATGKAVQCANACAQASTSLLAQQCNSFYCKTDFCVKCCGAGSWQCIGNDFTPQCAPTTSLSDIFAESLAKVRNESKKAISAVFNEATEEMEKFGEAVAETLEEVSAVTVPNAEHPKVQPCQCGPGSGDPNSCCSKCHDSGNPHSVPQCPGGGMNTGPFCGNDFHVTEPNACYGETPLCCTNDVGIPVCCRLGQVCNSPLTGDNSCMDANETIVV